VKTARAICHQLNNDLSVVIGSLELMQINPVPIPPELQALFATANQGAERVTADRPVVAYRPLRGRGHAGRPGPRPLGKRGPRSPAE
jgi:hypothetical protein